MKNFVRSILWCCAATPLILFVTGDPTGLPKFIWIFFTTVLLFWVGIKDGLFGYRNTFILPVWLFFIWCVITLTKCINIFVGLHSILLFILFITFYISLENLVVRDNSVIDIFMKYAAGVTFIISIYGILQVIGIDFLNWEVKSSALSTLGRRNFAGEYLVMVIPYIYYLAIREKKWFIYMVCIFSIVHLIFTFTRASYLAFFVSVIIFLILAGVKSPLRSKVVLIVIILLFTRAGFSAVKRFERGTITSRILIWKVTLKMIKENPLMGVGAGNFIINYPYYGIGEEALRGVSLVVDRVHNDYLEVAAEAGIPGLILFLYLLYYFFRVCFILYREADREKRLLVASIICSVIGICVNALASFPFKNPSTLLLFWINISFAGGLYKRLKGERHVKINYSFLKIYLGLFALTGFVLSYRGIQASRCIFFAKSLKGEKALIYAEKSVVYNPFSSESTFMAAKLATKQGEYKKAYKYLVMQKKYEPYSDILYNNLGLVYFHLRYFKEAEESFLYSLKLNPIVPDVHNNLGGVYLNTGRYDEAINCFLNAISLKPDFDLAYFNLGLTYYLKNEYKQAKMYLKKALKINPEFEDARRLLSEIEK